MYSYNYILYSPNVHRFHRRDFYLPSKPEIQLARFFPLILGVNDSTLSASLSLFIVRSGVRASSFATEGGRGSDGIVLPRGREFAVWGLALCLLRRLNDDRGVHLCSGVSCLIGFWLLTCCAAFLGVTLISEAISLPCNSVRSRSGVLLSGSLEICIFNPVLPVGTAASFTAEEAASAICIDDGRPLFTHGRTVYCTSGKPIKIESAQIQRGPRVDNA